MKWINSNAIGAIALVLGPLFRVAGVFTHPAEGLDAASYAAATTEPLWLIAHLANLAFVLLLALGFICLYQTLHTQDRSAIPLVGLFLILAWVVTRYLGTASDGFVAPAIAGEYLAAAGTTQEVLGSILVTNLVEALGLNTVGAYLFTGGLVLVGVSMWRAGLYGRILPISGVILGLLYLVGYPIGLFGDYSAMNDAWFYYQVASMTWALALGIVMAYTHLIAEPKQQAGTTSAAASV